MENRPKENSTSRKICSKNVACTKICSKQISLVGKSAQKNIVGRKIGPKQITLVGKSAQKILPVGKSAQVKYCQQENRPKANSTSMKIGSKKILPGGKSGRSKYWQIAMLSAMATACTTCHGRDTIKVKCLQHLNRNIWNTNKINCLSFKTFV